jgi:hypothetical protein
VDTILIEFGVSVKLVRPIKMCLYKAVCVGNNLSDKFPIWSGLKHGNVF